MNIYVKNIYEIIEDIKEKLTDYEYKTILDNLMILNKKKKKQEQEVEEEVEQEIYERIDELAILINVFNKYIYNIFFVIILCIILK